MKKQNNIETIIPEETIASRVLLFRNEKVILDFHLAQFYGTETRILKQAVKRNIARFPKDFMFQLSDNEIDILVSQNVIPSKSYLGGSMPFAFTESGVAMLSIVLTSKKAIEINIAIIRTFVNLRKMLANFSELEIWKRNIESTMLDHNNNIVLILDYLKQFEQFKLQETLQSERKPIGYKSN